MTKQTMGTYVNTQTRHVLRKFRNLRLMRVIDSLVCRAHTAPEIGRASFYIFCQASTLPFVAIHRGIKLTPVSIDCRSFWSLIKKPYSDRKSRVSSMGHNLSHMASLNFRRIFYHVRRQWCVWLSQIGGRLSNQTWVKSLERAAIRTGIHWLTGQMMNKYEITHWVLISDIKMFQLHSITLYMYMYQFFETILSGLFA